jgi:hypothetical protein
LPGNNTWEISEGPTAITFSGPQTGLYYLSVLTRFPDTPFSPVVLQALVQHVNKGRKPLTDDDILKFRRDLGIDETECKAAHKAVRQAIKRELDSLGKHGTPKTVAENLASALKARVCEPSQGPCRDFVCTTRPAQK